MQVNHVCCRVQQETERTVVHMRSRKEAALVFGANFD